MSWKINIEAVAEERKQTDGSFIKMTALAIAKEKVLRNKHAISETHHVTDDPVAVAESWKQRAANDVFENLLMHLPERFASITLRASGALHIDSLSFDVKGG